MLGILYHLSTNNLPYFYHDRVIRHYFVTGQIKKSVTIIIKQIGCITISISIYLCTFLRLKKSELQVLQF